MQIYRDLEEFPRLEKPIVTIGTFDGVHLGHQKILSRLKDIANQANGEVVVLTFHPHPRKVLFPNQNDLQLLSSLDEKVKLLSQHGVQHLVIHPFTKEFSQMEHTTFIEEILVKKLGVHSLVIGYDHQFGHDRKGSFKELAELAPSYGFKVEEIPEQDIDEVAISSTRIRKALFHGDIKDAAHLLGYDYQITGRVEKGKQLGRTLGFPTANLLPLDKDKLVPAMGVYAVLVEVKGETYKGVLSIGNRPTFDNGERSIEVNIFNFDGDIYNELVTLTFKDFLRGDIKFDSAADLIVQMNEDKAKSLELLSMINVKH